MNPLAHRPWHTNREFVLAGKGSPEPAGYAHRKLPL